MFKQITLREASVMAKSLTTNHYDEEGNLVEALSLEDALDEMELIDDLLAIMKSKSLLNKKMGLKRLISGRIEMALPTSTIVSGSSNKQLGSV